MEPTNFTTLKQLQGFTVYDYTVFTLMLTISAAIGIYYGCFGNQQASMSEYLSGGKKMSIIPISASFVASSLSAVTMLGVPAEVLKYGATYLLSSISFILSSIACVYIYLPVFFKLQYTSVFEYLEKRFDKSVRLFASFLYTLNSVLFLPITMYLPCLALSTISGISIDIIIPIGCGVCIFYTSIGGLKAVVWSDFLQLIIMMGCIVVILCISIESAGGFYNVWNKTVEGGRLDIFDFDPDPTKRDSFWTFAIGYNVYFISYHAISQTFIQKLLALPTLSDATKAIYYSTGCIILIKILCIAIGCIIFVLYGNCDPFKMNILTRDDQLLPYLITNVGAKIPGLAGVFVAGVFSASLSTFSSMLNCLSATIYEDFLKQNLNISLKRESDILKLIVVIMGVCCMGVIYIVGHLGGAVTVSVSLLSIIFGPLLGLFTLGMLCPCVNSKSALYGSIVSMVMTACIIIPAKFYQYMGYFSYPYKPTSIEECSFQNYTTVQHNLASNMTQSGSEKSEPFFLFRVSYYYYTLIGFLINVIVSLLISCATNRAEEQIDPDLISPVAKYFLTKKSTTRNHGDVRYTCVQKEDGRVFF